MAENKRALLIIFLVVFVDLLGFGVVMPLLPLYADRLDAGDWTIGLLQSSFSLMQFLFAPLWGLLSDRVGRRPILLLGLAGSVVFYALFGWASAVGSLPWMFAARIGAGISGATIATAQAFIADSTPPDRRTAGMAIIGAAFGMGFVFGPLLGAAALWLGTDEPAAGVTGLPGYMASAFSLGALILAIVMLPESLQKGQRSAHRGWLDFGHLRLALNIPGIVQLLGIFFLATFAFAKFESTIARFAHDLFELDLGQNFLLFAYFGFLLVLAQGGVRSLSKRVTADQIASLGSILLVFGMGGLVAAGEWGSWTLLVIAPVVLVTGFAFLTTATQSMISTRSPADEQGGVLGLNQSSSALARIAGPIVGNVTFGIKPTAPYWISAGLMVLVLGLILLLPRPATNPTDAG